MSKFVSAALDNRENEVFTENMGITYDTSSRSNVDLFFVIGALRGQNPNRLYSMFERAYQEDKELAVRIMLWARDIRGGAGERKVFRDLLQYMEKNHPEFLDKIINFTPEFGRWDDLLVFETEEFKNKAFSLIQNALDNKHGLAAKWMPRKGKVAVELREFMGLSPKAYRKLLVGLTNVVESKMCAKEWDKIDFGKLPSLASSRYNKAFVRNCGEAFSRYVEKLQKGEEKVNTGAVYPYDVLKPLIGPSFYAYGSRNSSVNNEFIIEQWNNMPNYLTEGKFILPMVDVSGSMAAICGGNLRCIDVSVSLGLYLSDFQTGAFKDLILTFSESPDFVHTKGNIVEKVTQLITSKWGMNTNLEKAFVKILEVAKKENVPQEDMPEYLLILSDMEFDYCVSGRTSFKDAQEKYAEAGYRMPKIVFWNIQSRHQNVPVKFNQEGVCLISGFSPAIMKSVLNAQGMSPESIMRNAVMVDRYNIWK